MPRAAYFKDFYTRDGVNRGRLLRQAVNQTEGALPHARRVVLQGVEGLILLVRPGVDRILPRRIMGDLGCSMHVAEFLERCPLSLCRSRTSRKMQKHEYNYHICKGRLR